ncbi:MAG: HlyD family type I secretion periplasmic adaptor subunit [Gammaproteobacteria bacterium]|nr:HlyD family type I secretion periplasmic adaptor subunit [Gammaproteobacteria bacterium]
MTTEARQSPVDLAIGTVSAWAQRAYHYAAALLQGPKEDEVGLSQDAADEKKELEAMLSRDVVMRRGIIVVVIALGGFLAWSIFAPLTEGVVAMGTVVVDTEHKTIQHLEGGIVENLYVHEGSEVKAGEVLVELSETQNRAQLELLESRYYGRLAEINRLNAERLLQEQITFSDELLARRSNPVIADILAVQENLFQVRRRQYHGQIEVLRYRIVQLEERVRGLEAHRGALQREQALIEKDLQSLVALRDQQLIDEGALIARQREYEQTVGNLGTLVADIAATRVKIGETRQEILQIENGWSTEVSDQVTNAQQEWFETRERINAVQDVLQRTTIVAPQDGRVIGLSVHTLGGVVPPGSAIMNIVPSEDRLMVEGQVRPTDVDNVYPDQVARLRFSAFSWRTTPEVEGRVARVSADAFRDEQTGVSYYIARILVPEAEMEKLGDITIGPGMPVDIMFTGGERTAWGYLTDPIMDIFRKALVEE